QGMRRVDYQYAQGPDLYIANSSTVAKRIEHHYGKDAMVVNYPIDSTQFIFSEQKDSYSLVSSRMLSYKKIDVTIGAFNQLGWPLKIIGDGPERDRLKAIAGPTVEFLGHVSDQERGTLMANAKYVVVSALEDYGLVPIEANASGTPVMSFGAGGVIDTQVPGKTGLFFETQTADSLAKALQAAEDIDWNPSAIRDHAMSNFSQKVFFEKIDCVIDDFCRANQLKDLNPVRS
ncbi:MAG: glycosyltransferase, partial [Cyanobacteria bacterium P01_F01_bin.42]